MIRSSRPSPILLALAFTAVCAAEEQPVPVPDTAVQAEFAPAAAAPAAPVVPAAAPAAPMADAAPAAPVASAPVVVPYTLEQALAEAALHATGPGIAKARLENVRTLQKQAWSLLMPSVVLNGSYGPEWTNKGPYKGRADETIAGDATVSIRLFNGSAFPALAEAKQQYAAQEFSSRDIRRATAFGVSSAYLTVLTAERLESVAHRQLKVANQLLDEAQARLKAGLAIASDVTRAEVSVADGQLSVTQAQRAKEIGRLALNEALGGMAEAGALVDPVISAPEDQDPKRLLDRADKRDDLAAARKQLEANDSEIERIRRNNWPIISANAGVRDVNSNAPLLQDSIQDPVWFVGLAATWTVYDGGLTSGQVEQQAAVGREQREQLRATWLTAQRQVRSALVEIHTALIAVTQAEALARSAEADATDAFARYRAGTGTATELADAQFRAAKASADLAERRIDVLSSRLLLRQSLGGWPLSDAEPVPPDDAQKP